MNRLLVKGAPATLDTNIRVVQYGTGTVVIPHGPNFTAMRVYDGKSLSGTAAPLQCDVNYDAAKLGKAGSFLLKRGYMATLAQQGNGTGVSKNYVAQDHDVVVDALPSGLDEGVRGLSG